MFYIPTSLSISFKCNSVEKRFSWYSLFVYNATIQCWERLLACKTWILLFIHFPATKLSRSIEYLSNVSIFTTYNFSQVATSKAIVQPWSVRALPGNQLSWYVVSEGHPLLQWVVRIGSQWAVQVFQTCKVPMVHHVPVKQGFCKAFSRWFCTLWLIGAQFGCE